MAHVEAEGVSIPQIMHTLKRDATGKHVACTAILPEASIVTTSFQLVNEYYNLHDKHMRVKWISDDEFQRN
jgi:hypothetical protein